MFSFIALTPHFLDLDALHGFTRRQHEDFAKFSEEKGEQPFRNAPVFALQDFLLMSVSVGDIDFDFVFQFHRFVLLFLICIAAEDGCISFLTHYREIQPSEEVRSGRSPTAVCAAVHGSVLLRVLVAFHTLDPERLSHLVNNLVLAVGHRRGGQ